MLTATHRHGNGIRACRAPQDGLGAAEIGSTLRAGKGIGTGGIGAAKTSQLCGTGNCDGQSVTRHGLNNTGAIGKLNGDIHQVITALYNVTFRPQMKLRLSGGAQA